MSLARISGTLTLLVSRRRGLMVSGSCSTEARPASVGVSFDILPVDPTGPSGPWHRRVLGIGNPAASGDREQADPVSRPAEGGMAHECILALLSPTGGGSPSVSSFGLFFPIAAAASRRMLVDGSQTARRQVSATTVLTAPLPACSADNPPDVLAARTPSCGSPVKRGREIINGSVAGTFLVGRARRGHARWRGCVGSGTGASIVSKLPLG